MNLTREPFFLACHQCGTRAFLFRGLCMMCAPALHAEYEREQQAYRDLAVTYEHETGAVPLSDWEAFEVWCQRRIALVLGTPIDCGDDE